MPLFHYDAVFPNIRLHGKRLFFQKKFPAALAKRHFTVHIINQVHFSHSRVPLFIDFGWIFSVCAKRRCLEFWGQLPRGNCRKSTNTELCAEAKSRRKQWI